MFTYSCVLVINLLKNTFPERGCFLFIEEKDTLFSRRPCTDKPTVHVAQLSKQSKNVHTTCESLWTSAEEQIPPLLPPI